MRRATIALGAALLATVALSLAVTGSRAATPARVIDRTLLCSTTVHAGVRKIDVFTQSAAPGQKDFRGNKAVAATRVSTGSSSSGFTLAAMAAGGARPGAIGGSSLLLSDEQCGRTSARVALSARGLAGGAASPFGDGYECFPPRRILVRVRAVFRAPVSLRLDRLSGLLTTSAALQEAYLAVVTQAGRPLAFAGVLESGKARLFATSSCVPE